MTRLSTAASSSLCRFMLRRMYVLSLKLETIDFLFRPLDHVYHASSDSPHFHFSYFIWLISALVDKLVLIVSVLVISLQQHCFPKTSEKEETQKHIGNSNLSVPQRQECCQRSVLIIPLVPFLQVAMVQISPPPLNTVPARDVVQLPSLMVRFYTAAFPCMSGTESDWVQRQQT